MSPPPVKDVKEDARPETDAEDAPESLSGADSGGPVEKREAAKSSRKEAESSLPPLGKKETVGLVLRGAANGIVLVLMTQELSSWYFEPPKSALVGLIIAMICCMTQMLAAGPMARFIVYYRFILRAAREDRNAPDHWAAKWMHEIVTNVMSLFITLLLLALSRLFV